MKNKNKNSTISIRFTDEEKELLNHASFMQCKSIADIVRGGKSFISKMIQPFKLVQKGS